jgi:membrane-associated PAP2 superfamily phosphatase
MRAPAAPEQPGQPEHSLEILLGRRTLIRSMLLLAVAALALVWLGRGTDIDLVLADRVFDRAAGVFPWRHAWLTETFSHGILKLALTAAAVLAVLAAAVDLVRPRLSPGQRLRLRIVALSAILVPLVTSTLKHESIAHCPWDLERYGGSEAYVRLFDALPPGALPGHCLPGGHASAALWLLSLVVFWLPHAPRKALAAGVATAVFGLAMGWMQQLRGAHFLTHTLWSLWIAVALVLLVTAGLQRRVARPAPVPALLPHIDALDDPDEVGA